MLRMVRDKRTDTSSSSSYQATCVRTGKGKLRHKDILIPNKTIFPAVSMLIDPTWSGASALSQNIWINPFVRSKKICVPSQSTSIEQRQELLRKPHIHLHVASKHMSLPFSRWKTKPHLVEPESLAVYLDSVEIGREQLRTLWPSDIRARVILLALDVSGDRHICGKSNDEAVCTTPYACLLVTTMLATLSLNRLDMVRAISKTIVKLLRNSTLIRVDETNALAFAHAVADMVCMARDATEVGDPFAKLARQAYRFFSGDANVLDQMCAPYLAAIVVRRALVQAGIDQASIECLVRLRETHTFLHKGTMPKMSLDQRMIRGDDDSGNFEDNTDDDEDDDEDDDDDDDEPIENTPSPTPHTEKTCRTFVRHLLMVHQTKTRTDLHALAYALQCNYRKSISKTRTNIQFARSIKGVEDALDASGYF
jgi:hypothetical protein